MIEQVDEREPALKFLCSILRRETPGRLRITQVTKQGSEPERGATRHITVATPFVCGGTGGAPLNHATTLASDHNPHVVV